MYVADYGNMLNSLSSKELKETLLEKVTFAIDNYGKDPKEYYEWKNIKIDKINEGLKEIIFMNKAMFDDDGEDIVKKLYVGCNYDNMQKEGIVFLESKEEKCELVDKQRVKSSLFETKEYKEFYVDLNDYMSLWLYGAKRKGRDGYSVLFHKLVEMQFMLEEGRPRNETLYKRYKKDLAGNNKPEGRDFSFG